MNRELKIIALQDQVTELRKQLVKQKESNISEDDFKTTMSIIFNVINENSEGKTKRNILNGIVESLGNRISFPKF